VVPHHQGYAAVLPPCLTPLAQQSWQAGSSGAAFRNVPSAPQLAKPPARVPPAADIAPNAAPLRIVQPAGFLRISTFTRRLHLQRIDSSHRGVLPKAWWLKSQACHPEAARRPRVVPWFGNHHAGRHVVPRRPDRFRSASRIITGGHPNKWYTWNRADRRVSVPQGKDGPPCDKAHPTCTCTKSCSCWR